LYKRNFLAAAIILVSSAAMAQDHIRLPFLSYPEDRAADRRRHNRHKDRIPVIQDDVKFTPLPDQEPPPAKPARAPTPDPVVPEVAIKPLPATPQPSSQAVATDPAQAGQAVPRMVKTVPFSTQASGPPPAWAGTLTPK
jgi:hypothetical protein